MAETEDTLKTLWRRVELADGLADAGDPAAAFAYEQVLSDLLRVLGPDDPATLMIRYRLGNAVSATGDARRAARIFEKWTTEEVRLRGEEANLGEAWAAVLVQRGRLDDPTEPFPTWLGTSVAVRGVVSPE